jgi:hypothetical protein
MGRKPTCALQKVMSALPPKATNVSFEILQNRDCQADRAVHDRTSLHLLAPQNGNFQNIRQRLSAKILSFEVMLDRPETR